MNSQENLIPNEQENQSKTPKNKEGSSLHQQQTENQKQIHKVLDDQFYEEKSELFFPIILEQVYEGAYDDEQLSLESKKYQDFFGTHHINVEMPQAGKVSGVYYDIMTPGKQARNIYKQTRQQLNKIEIQMIQYIKTDQIKSAKKLFKLRLKLTDKSKSYFEYYQKNKKTETISHGMKERPN